MSRILAVGNYKGGVGKTLISKTIAEYAAIVKRKRVLMIDLDPQTNLSRRYLDMEPSGHQGADYQPPLHPDFDPSDTDWNGRSDSSDIWYGGGCEPYPTEYDGLELIPAHSGRLQDIELARKAEVFDQIVRRLNDFLTLPVVQETYDLIVLDTRPSRGPLVQAALHAATDLLIPSEMEAPSIEGLHGMLSVRSRVNQARSRDKALNLVGILPNKVKANTRLHEEFMGYLRGDPVIGPALLPIQIPDWMGFRESMVFGEPSLFLQPESNRFRKTLETVSEHVLQSVFQR